MTRPILPLAINRSLTAALLAITLTLGCGGVAEAAEQDFSPNFPGVGAQTERSERLKTAKVINTFCHLYSDLIPPLSPREKDWLHKELNENGPRQMEAAQSIEFVQEELGDVVRACSDLSGKLMTNIPLKNEMYLWGLLAFSLNSFNIESNIDDLVEKKLFSLTKKHKEASDKFHFLGYQTLQFILIPYLKP
jgi:hypothetical protein